MILPYKLYMRDYISHLQKCEMFSRYVNQALVQTNNNKYMSIGASNYRLLPVNNIQLPKLGT